MTIRKWSQIAVVGAGAIGCYFGGLLARAGSAVTLIGRRKHVDPINRDGLHFISRDRDEFIALRAAEDIAAAGDAGLILFCVKSSDTEDVARVMAPHLAKDAVVLSLQNGVDNVERIRRHVRNPVLPVLIYAAAEMPAPGTVRHTGGGNIVMGLTRDLRTGDELAQRLLDDIAALFTGAGVPVKVSSDIEAELWTKLVMNCAYNAICALSGAPYGQMVAMPEIRDVMSEAVDEVVKVAAAKGVALPGDLMDAVFKLAEAMPRTMSSTAQDIAGGRPTEIDHLNGYVMREGEALGIKVPVNRTLSALMKLLEQTKLGRPE